MHRELDPVLLQARDAVEARLQRDGFSLQYETLYYEAAFGSATIEYRHRRCWLQLKWDGKDRYLWVIGALSTDQHTFPVRDAWHPLDTGGAGVGGGQRLQLGPRVDARIATLIDQIETFLASSAVK
jgi:hypothetical protein